MIIKPVNKGIGIQTRADGTVKYNSWCEVERKMFGVIPYLKRYYSGFNINKVMRLTDEDSFKSWYNSSEEAALNLENAIITSNRHLLKEKVVSYVEQTL
jgi:hypothetical protein